MQTSSAEQWVPIAEFPHYLISSYGNVRHVNRLVSRTITINERGFPVILLSSASSPTRYARQINHLVAEAFLPEPYEPDMTSVWHKDGDLTNCHVDNLRWETRTNVTEWNEMHRRGGPKVATPPVRNNRTGVVYDNAWACAMAEGMLESSIVWRIERQAINVFDTNARYCYVPQGGFYDG